MNAQVFRVARQMAARRPINFSSAIRHSSTTSSAARGGSAPADYRRLFSQVARTGIIYFPAALLILGWPLGAHKIVDSLWS